MKKNDRNIQQLKKRFNLKTSKTPKLLFKGSGDIKGSSVGYKEIEIIFSRSKEENIYYVDSVEFVPSNKMTKSWY